LPFRLRQAYGATSFRGYSDLMKRILILLALAAAGLKPALGATVAIAAAADLTYCIQDLNKAYQQSHPDTELKLSTGSSGNFYTQIEHGAPYDVFLSADISFPRKLIQEGFADGATLSVYSIGRLAIWTTKPETVSLDKGIEVLRDSTVKRIAIANPEFAPYGRAAKAALETAGLWDDVQSRLVTGENIAQTAQFVQSGNADVGFVALSLLYNPSLKNVGRYIQVDPKLYPPLQQALVLTKNGGGNSSAHDYLQFLAGQEARSIFDRYGFEAPPK
jgi:molybdate transport system substrate-binding protein